MKLAIIGNGKLSKNYGRRIDKADVVVRFNGARIKGHEKTHGEKTDILGLAGATALSCEGEASKIDPVILQNVGQVMFSGRKRNEGYEKILLKKKAAFNADRASIVFNYIDYTCYNELTARANVSGLHKLPSTGMNILSYLLFVNTYVSNENKFFIYGFDCFDTGHYWENHTRNDTEYHDISAEKAVIEYLKRFKNIRFFN